MHVRFQDSAEADLDAIALYIGPESSSGLVRILVAITTVAAQLETFPMLGHRGSVEGTRELSVPGTPYRLIYVIDEPYTSTSSVFCTASEDTRPETTDGADPPVS